jgi:hypothetical protein
MKKSQGRSGGEENTVRSRQTSTGGRTSAADASKQGVLFLGTYHVHMDIPCIYRAHEITKLKKTEKITHIFLIIFHLYIKF